MYKNNKLLIFYTTDLCHTLKEDIYKGTQEKAIAAVHGLCPFKQWTGSETL